MKITSPTRLVELIEGLPAASSIQVAHIDEIATIKEKSSAIEGIQAALEPNGRYVVFVIAL